MEISSYKFERVDMFEFLQNMVKVEFCLKGESSESKKKKKIKKVKLNRKRKRWKSEDEEDEEGEKKKLS